jgi:hypothetical protein
MKFSIQHQRAVVGNDLLIGIEAEGKEQISRVTTTLDGFDVGDDALDPPAVSYEHQFLQAGAASPHLLHQLTVVVTDPEGKVKSADRRWEDVT